MIWNVVARKKARKVLQRIPLKEAIRINEVLEDLSLNPFGGDVEKMMGEENSWRRRVGAYRIFYEISVEKRTVLVYRIERRTSKTY